MMMVYHSTYICTFKAQNSVVLFQKHCYFYITIVVPFTYTGLGGNPKFKLVTKKNGMKPKVNLNPNSHELGTSFNQQYYFKAEIVLYLHYIYCILNLYKHWMTCPSPNHVECQPRTNAHVNLKPNSHENGSSFNLH